MAKTLSYPMIVGILKQQQETVSIVDKYIQSVQLSSTTPNCYANFVMRHMFVSIRNSYQDGIFISQGLISSSRYYISTALSHANRTAQEFLVDLAYIMSDYKHKSGHEYLRYLKFVIDKEIKVAKELGENTITEDQYNEMFPPDLDLEPKSPSQWSHTNPRVRIKEGLELYKIEPPHFADFRFRFHSALSSTAHGNDSTTYTLIRTPEENLPKLESDLTASIAHFQVVLLSALKCYIKLYLGRNKDYREIVQLCFPASIFKSITKEGVFS